MALLWKMKSFSEDFIGFSGGWVFRLNEVKYYFLMTGGFLTVKLLGVPSLESNYKTWSSLFCNFSKVRGCIEFLRILFRLFLLSYWVVLKRSDQKYDSKSLLVDYWS